MNLRFITCCVLLLAVLQTFGQQIEPNYKIFSAQHGLSQNTVTSILEDREGFIWIATLDGLNKFDGYNFTHYRLKKGDSTSISSNLITGLAEDSFGNIWIATDNAGVCKFDKKTAAFERFSSHEDDSTTTRYDRINKLFIDSKNQIRVSHAKGVDIYDPESGSFKKIALGFENASVQEILEDTHKNIWFNVPYIGLIRYDPATDSTKLVYEGHFVSAIFDAQDNLLATNRGMELERFSPYAKEKAPSSQNLNKGPTNVFTFYPTNSKKLYYTNTSWELVVYDEITGETECIFNCKGFEERFLIFSVFIDKSGSVWIGTETNGIVYLGANGKPFHFNTTVGSTSSNKYTPSHTVFEIFEDSKGYLWTEDTDHSAVRINPRDGSRKKFPKLDAIIGTSRPGVRIFNFLEDDQGGIWVLGQIIPPIRLNPENGNCTTYERFAQEFANKSGFWFMYGTGLQTQDGLIWLGSTSGSLIAYNLVTNTIEKRFSSSEPLLNNARKLPFQQVIVIYEGLSNELYIGSEKGVFLLDPDTGVFTEVLFLPEVGSDISSKQVYSIYQNQRNIIWIGTTNGFFKYDVKNKTTISYGLNEGLTSTIINDILEDNEGYLWLTTNAGISRFDSSNGIFKNYDAEDGLKQLEFNVQASVMSKHDEKMYLGGTRGYNFFDPKKIKENPNVPEIVITSFKKNNQELGFVKVPAVNYRERIRLKDDEKDFSVEFAALDYTNPSKNQYAYQLVGYNDKWIQTGTKRDVTFTSLAPGEYLLKIKGSNNDGVWNTIGKSLAIEILPPWWATWWAYGLYTLAMLTLLYGAYRYRSQQLNNKRLVELDKVKRTMYTNITHEFRTPITIISGINKELQEHFKGQREDHFDLIDRNSQNMLYLVNQLLELRKMEIGKITVDYVQDDVIAYLKYIQESFSSYVKTKNIIIHFISSLNEIVMDFDPNKLLIIISNLISNAIKHTDSGGNIYLQIDQINEYLQIKVSDSGRGIAAKELPHIFDRFYKVVDKDSDNMDGIGIGLALTKELVQILNGKITVTSKLGVGSVFTVLLPIEHTAELANFAEFVAANPQLPKYFQENKANFDTKILTDPIEEKPTILIIEDNHDIIAYLITCLQEIWNIHLAHDGKEGVEKAIEIVPDIILTDLMMPELDGYGVLNEVKSNELSSHIPVVMLTAKADEETRIEAYKKGADSFLVKPFNKSELLVVLEKLVEQRKALQKRYKTQDSFINTFEVKLQKEDSFILKLEKMVLSNHTDATSGVEALCLALAMSRTQLHNKVKALTGMSTSIFVRTIRLKRAKYLLVNTDKAISEIAYEVGFNHASYFSRSFTEEFGLPPSSIRR